MTNNSKTILLVDMDIVAYRSAAAVEDRTIKVKHLSSGRTKDFKTRTEFKAFLEKSGFTYVESDYEIEDVQTLQQDESIVKSVVKKQIDKAVDALDADEIEGYVGGEDNFRLNLPLPKVYKGNRENMIRPLLLNKTKEYALNNYRGKLVQGCEVDDYVVIRYHQLSKQGHNPVIITIDKDNKGCIGTKFCDFTKEEFNIVEVPVWGFLKHIKEKNKVDGLGVQFYCYQLLKGDTSDGYSPSDLHSMRYGDTKIVNLINECKTIDELFLAVERTYKKFFPKPVTYTDQTGKEVTMNHEDLLNLYHKCVYMQRVENDTTNFFDLWRELR